MILLQYGEFEQTFHLFSILDRRIDSVPGEYLEILHKRETESSRGAELYL
jgi:hypothetical protein